MFLFQNNKALVSFCTALGLLGPKTRQTTDQSCPFLPGGDRLRGARTSHWTNQERTPAWGAELPAPRKSPRACNPSQSMGW